MLVHSAARKSQPALTPTMEIQMTITVGEPCGRSHVSLPLPCV